MARQEGWRQGGRTLADKILEMHKREASEGDAGEIGLRVDQAFLHDATGTVACRQIESMGVSWSALDTAVCYIDHNIVQASFETSDDHRYLRTFLRGRGITVYKAGSGIASRVHLERCARPGAVIVGADSYAAACGAVGALSLSGGSIDVAAAVAGMPYFLERPQVVAVELSGRFRTGVSAFDLGLHLLRLLTVRGGEGRILEFRGKGAAALTVTERFTVGQILAESEVLAVLFPADERVSAFLKRWGRSRDFRSIKPDKNASYDDTIRIDLSKVEPLVACPHSPDHVVPVRDVAGTRVDQVCLGGGACGGYQDLASISALLRGKKVPEHVEVVYVPASRAVLAAAIQSGLCAPLFNAGVRFLEPGCGPSIGLGLVPATASHSLRTFSRNTERRSGNPDSRTYLASPLTASLSALAGELVDPGRMRVRIGSAHLPNRFPAIDPLRCEPVHHGRKREEEPVQEGPNIRGLPDFEAYPDRIAGEILTRLGDRVTTDQILPGGFETLRLRSNLPELANRVLSDADPFFVRRAKERGGGIILAGENYGLGAPREHAALATRMLGVVAVVAKSFGRFHRKNLVHSGVLPLRLARPEDYEILRRGETLEGIFVRDRLREGERIVLISNMGKRIETIPEVKGREIEILLAGGYLNYVRAFSAGKEKTGKTRKREAKGKKAMGKSRKPKISKAAEKPKEGKKNPRKKKTIIVTKKRSRKR
ncbi:MAG: aconitate hydratase [Candidatus Hydrogenedentota bacterium]|nr:MAG: aconitate hydratase [Candidatus Hydrogenedentota bacterium]